MIKIQMEHNLLWMWRKMRPPLFQVFEIKKRDNLTQDFENVISCINDYTASVSSAFTEGRLCIVDTIPQTSLTIKKQTP